MPSPPTTLHPDGVDSTLNVQSSPGIPAPTERAEDSGQDGLEFGKAGGRDQDAVEAGTPAAVPQDQEGEEGEEEDVPQLPSVELIQRYMDRLEMLDGAEDVKGSRDEMKQMLDTVLPPLQTTAPLLMLQLEAQRETIANLQQSIKVSTQLAKLETDRHLAEKRSWQAETRALIRKNGNSSTVPGSAGDSLAEGSMVNGKLQLKVGYHQELEAANKRLEMDNRLMAPRLADTQQQIESLVNELRHLRPHVITHNLPTQPSRSPNKRSPRHHHTMGDARTEHLLLAARHYRKLRENDPSVGMVSMEELKANKVVGPQGGVGYAEGYGGIQADDEPDLDMSTSSRRPSASASKPKTIKKQPRNASNPLLPQTPRQRGKAAATPRQVLQPTPGGGGFGDLLLAASMATRPSTPEASHERLPVIQGYDPESSPSKRRRVETTPKQMTWTPGQETDSDGPVAYDSSPLKHPSALDLLASASALEDTPTLATSARFSGLMNSGSGSLDDDDETRSLGNASHHSALGPAISLRASPPQFRIPESPTQRTPSSSMPTPGATPRPRVTSKVPQLKKTPTGKVKVKGEPMQQPTPILTPDGFASPAGGTVPGLGKYVHLTSKMPARRERSPYLKWTVEEDELLARAVAQYGEKWDMVSKGVPTRSYHQVRQRWLRRTGAFDKKNQTTASTLGLQQVTAMSDDTDDDDGRDVTPTPGKKKLK